jgi:hypothetical protein
MSRKLGPVLALGVVVAGGIYAYLQWHSIQATLRRTGILTAPPAVRAPSEVIAADELTAQPVIATVYECVTTQGRTFSDKPCGDDAQTREIHDPNRMDAVSVQPPASSAPRAGSSSSDSDPKSQAQNSASVSVTIPAMAKTCAEVDEREAELKSRWQQMTNENMKSGYRRALHQYSQDRKRLKCER